MTNIPTNDSLYQSTDVLGKETQPLVLFDGLCNLCSTSVQTIIRYEKSPHLRFASLQSPLGQRILALIPNQRSNDLSSVIFVVSGTIYTHSTAALKIAQHLRFPAHILQIGWLIPRFIRDKIYTYIANHRYTWFGEKDQCWLPTPELRSRFVEE